MQDGDREQTHRIPFYKRLAFKFYAIAVIAAVVLMIFPLYLLGDSMNYVVSNLMHRQLTVDLNLLFDEFEEHSEQDAFWSRKDGALYIGNRMLGDGTLENSDTEVFSHCEKMSGSYYYSFVKTENDGELSSGEGHYLRVAGSTKGRFGERIEGTYIDKNVADLLEASKNGECFIVANVAGRRIRTLYRVIRGQDGSTVGVLAAGRSEEELQQYIRKQKRAVFALIILVMLVVFACIGNLLRRLFRKLSAMKAHLDRIGEGNFPESPLSLAGNDELNVVADTINQMTVSLREKKRMGAELLVASDIQKRLLPTEAESRIPENILDIAADMKPAKEIAGDFYDYFMVGDREVFFTVADVSGKGLPASLFMVRTKTLVKSFAQTLFSPGEILEKTNRALCEGNDEEFFVTAWLGRLDLETGELCYVNAGHNPPVLQTADGNCRLLNEKKNFVLAGFERTAFHEEHLVMKPGDSIFLYTDGVTEALNKEDEFFGTEKLCDCLSRCKGEESAAVLTQLWDELRTFIGEEEQNDDVTVLRLSYLEKMSPVSGKRIREFEASDRNLQQVLDYAEEELTKLRVSEKELFGFFGVVEEVFLNIAHYAYGGAAGMMTLEFRRDEKEAVHLLFTDYGIPFNPLRIPDPDTTLEMEDRKEGGLGIYLVKIFSDDISYRYEDGKNILEITKENGLLKEKP